MTIATQIATLYTELQVRESAAGHLKGIPKQQNQTAINGLYDRLVDLNIKQIEGGE